MSSAGQSEYGSYVDQAANAFGIPTQILQSLVSTESSWNPNATSSAGAIGLTQLMPATAAQIGVDPYDPLQNIAGGAKYLSQLYSQFGNWSDALAAYNAGPGNIAAGQTYAQNVLNGAAALGYSPASSTSTASPAASTASTSTSDLPSWLQGILTWAGVPNVSFTNILLYVLAILALIVVAFFGIKSLFPSTIAIPENK